MTENKQIKTKRHGKRSDLVKGNPTVGFVDFFAPKFTPLLQEEYLHETNEQIYERLIHIHSISWFDYNH